MNTKILSYFSAASVTSVILGIVFNALALALFAVAVSALILLIVATDYAPRRCYSRVLCLASDSAERNPLAA